MRLKKLAAEYFGKREQKSKPVGFMSLEQFFRKHFHSICPSFVKNGVGATRVGVKNYIRLKSIVDDLGKMGIIRDVDDVLDAIDDLVQEYY